MYSNYMAIRHYTNDDGERVHESTSTTFQECWYTYVNKNSASDVIRLQGSRDERFMLAVVNEAKSDIYASGLVNRASFEEGACINAEADKHVTDGYGSVLWAEELIERYVLPYITERIMMAGVFRAEDGIRYDVWSR